MKIRLTLFFPLIAIFLLSASSVYAAEIDCLPCHEQLAKEKVVHAAVQMGCVTCHTEIDATDVPHKKKGKAPKGLSSDQPELCFGCHDKAKFQKKKHVHAAVSMGCTGCHNPHSSKNAKLLVSEPPDLCFTCHDKTKFTGETIHSPVKIGLCLNCHAPHQSDNAKLLVSDVPDLCFSCHDKGIFSRKNVHMPVAGGLCLSCHGPHATKEEYLLLKRPVYVCLECHGKVRDGSHVITGLTSRSGHPIGPLKKQKNPPKDPARPGRNFYCGSCHDAHSSDSIKLFRYEAKSSMGLCQYCHKY